MFTKEYYKTIELYKKMHSEGTEYDSALKTFDGKSLKFFFKTINEIIINTNSKSLIDFGCGKAKYYFEEVNIDNDNYKNICEYWKIKKYFLYDPGLKKFSNYPNKKADGVLCVDVLEHIPEKDISNFIHEIFNLSKKFIFINIACYPAKKTLPDGRNVHMTIKNPDDWKKIISGIKINFPNIFSFVVCATNRKNFVRI